MFTGLIEHTTVLASVKETERLRTMTFNNPFNKLNTGDSVSVNGTCLTTVYTDDDIFTVDVINETGRLTTLSDVSLNDTVNLERAMKMNGRLDGHLVSGHVDGTGDVLNIGIDGDSVTVDVHLPEKLMKYMVHKGSVTIDGISLTLFEVNTKDSVITLNIIPETYRKTNMKHLKQGDAVNIEADMIVKHVDHLMHYGGAGHV